MFNYNYEMRHKKIIVPKGNYITESSTVDGPGFRDVLWLQGCNHHCKNCHNPETWEIRDGQFITLEEAYNALTKSPITNITLSGGDPILQADKLLILVKKIKLDFPSKNIWIYTGYTFEELSKLGGWALDLVYNCDVLVDGRFIEEEKDETLKFRGSRNQRIIDIKKSIDKSEIVLWEDESEEIL